MNSSEKRKVFFLIGVIWLLAIILICASIIAWYVKVGTFWLLLLFLLDFLVISAVATTLTVPFLLWRHKRHAKKDADKN